MDFSSLKVSLQDAPVWGCRQGRGDRPHVDEEDLQIEGRQMARRFLTRSLRRNLGISLFVLGLVVWLVAVGWPVLGGAVVSMPHFEARALGVIAGGAAVAVGLILIVTAL
jgi:hypothetical protein